MHQPKFITRRRIVFAALSTVLAITVAFLIFVTAPWFGFRITDAITFIGAPLPVDARNIDLSTQKERGRIVWLRFEIPDDFDISTFVNEIGLNTHIQDGFTPFPNPNYLETSIEWWTPYSAQEFSGIHAIMNGKVYEMLIDKNTRPGRNIVFLRVYAVGRS